MSKVSEKLAETKRQRAVERSRRNQAALAKRKSPSKLKRQADRKAGVRPEAPVVRSGGFKLREQGQGTQRAREREQERHSVLRKLFPNILTRAEKREIELREKAEAARQAAKEAEAAQDLSKLTVPVLRKLAGDNGVKGYSKLAKPALIEAIEKARS